MTIFKLRPLLVAESSYSCFYRLAAGVAEAWGGEEGGAAAGEHKHCTIDYTSPH